MKKLMITGLLAIAITLQISAQTQQDTIFNYLTSTPVAVDGVDTEDCWDEAEWNSISRVWLPTYNASMSDGDFEGRFKVAWDADYLYLLVEVVDNMLSDDHIDPLDSWWDDDCLEIFIDEDRSKGDHQTNNNAFAYHVSQFYDVIDMSPTGSGINYKDHLDVVLTDLGDNTYLWELAIRIYADDYDHSSPEDSRVTLTDNKVMGFTLAYCDNDETTGRENFIGSMDMPADRSNDNYKTADFFGSMKLVTEGYVQTRIESRNTAKWECYPNPVSDILHVSAAEDQGLQHELTIRSVTGQVLRTEIFENASHTMDISDLYAGIYLLTIEGDGTAFSRSLIKL